MTQRKTGLNNKDTMLGEGSGDGGVVVKQSWWRTLQQQQQNSGARTNPALNLGSVIFAPEFCWVIDCFTCIHIVFDLGTWT